MKKPIKEIKEDILDALDDNPKPKCKICGKKDKLVTHKTYQKNQMNLIQICVNCHRRIR